MLKITITCLLLLVLLPSQQGLLFALEQKPTNVARTSAPSGLQAKISKNTVILQWQPVAGAEGYRIYWEREGVVTSTSPCLDSLPPDRHRYEVSSLTLGTHYSFSVSAIRGMEESPLSQQVGVIPAKGGKLQSNDTAP